MDDESKAKLSPHDIRTIAVKARCNPVTVMRWIAGKPVQRLSLDRIQEALKALGFV